MWLQTTQSVNFNTARQGDAESLRTGQESQKTYQTYQDERGVGFFLNSFYDFL